MKVWLKILLVAIVVGAILASLAGVIYLKRVNVENALNRTNSAIAQTKKEHNLTLKVADLRYTSTYALSILNLGVFSNNASTLNVQRKAFNDQISKAIEMSNALTNSNIIREIKKNLEALKTNGNIVLSQTASLIKDKEKLQAQRQKASNYQTELIKIQGEIGKLFSFNEKLYNSISASYTNISSKANGLSSLSGSKLKAAQSKIASEVRALPIGKTSITDLEHLLTDFAGIAGVSQAQNAITSMKLSVRQIRLASNQTDIDNQIQNLKVYVQNYRMVLGMGLLNYADVTYGNILLNRYLKLATEFANLVKQLNTIQSESESQNTIVQGYSSKISKQQKSISNLLNNNIRKTFNNIVSEVSIMFANVNNNLNASLKNVNQSSKEVSSAFESLIYIFLIMVIVAIAVMVISLLFLTLDFTKILNRLKEVSHKIKDGDLTLELKETKRKDEFGILQNAFKDMLESLKNIVKNIKESTSSINGGSQNLSAAMEENSATVQEVGANLERMKNSTRAAVEKLSEMVEKIEGLEKLGDNTADNAQEVKNAAQKSVEISHEGQKQIEQMVQGLLKTKDVILEGARSIENLKESYASISKFVETIESIAEQTNLLALNAAIEAARAGEAGKGFAVVAEEIRSLAEESNKAAEEIRNQINSLQNDVKSTTNDVESGAKSIEELSSNANAVVESVSKTIDAFENINEKVEKIAQALQAQKVEMSETAADSKEKEEAFKEMLQTIESISESLNESGKAVSDIANTAEELARISEKLDKLAKKFKTE